MTKGATSRSITPTLTRNAVLVLIIAFCSSQAYAFDCEDNEGLIWIYLRACEAGEYYEKYEAADKQLNEIYKELQRNAKEYDREIENEEYRILLPGLSEAIRETQRAWIRFRDTECNLGKFGWTHVQDRDFAVSKCLHEKTLQRTEELKFHMKRFGGG